MQKATESRILVDEFGYEDTADELIDPLDYWEPDRDSGNDFDQYDNRLSDDSNDDFYNDTELAEKFWMDFTRLYEEDYGKYPGRYYQSSDRAINLHETVSSLDDTMNVIEGNGLSGNKSDKGVSYYEIVSHQV